MRTTLFLLLLAAASGSLLAQSVDDGYNPNVTNGSVNALANGPEGAVLAGGSFTNVDGLTAQRLIRLGIDGKPISSVPVVGNGVVHATLGTSEGNYWFGGSFTQVAGQTVPRVARRRANGQAVPGFTSPAPNSTVRALAEASGNRVYIGGQFTEVAGQPRSRVARLNNNGSLDASFSPPNFTGTVYALAEQSDGKLIVAGTLQREGDIAPRRLYRLNADGSWDSDFLVTNIVSSPFTIFAVAVQDDGKIVVAGDFGGYIRRYHSDGSLDTDFTPPSLNGAVRALALQPDGRLIIGGDFTNLNQRNRIARLNEDGSLDTRFANGLMPDNVVRALSLQPDGSVVIGGDFTTINSVPRNRIARLDASGRMHLTLVFGGTTNGAIRALALEPDGNLLVGGEFSVFNGQQRRALVRVGDGIPVSGFAPGFPLGGGVNAIAVQPDGRILLAGTFTMITGSTGASSFRMGRIFPDGTYDQSFSSPIDQIAWVESMLLQDDGRIMIGGNFDNLGGQSLSGLARLNNDGSIDPSFQPPEFDDEVLAIIQDGVGGYLVGGRFNSPRPNLVRLLADGSLDESFLPNSPNQEVRALAVGRNGTLVGGNFTSIGGQPCRGLARLNLSGAVSPDCPQTGPLVPVRAIVPRADGTFFMVTPSEARLMETPTQGFANWTTPSVDSATERLNSAIVQPDGRLVVGGQFASIGGQTRRGLARLSMPQGGSSLEQSITWNQGAGQIRWQRAADSGAPEVIGRPRLLVSALCCDPATFSPVAGGGIMTRSGDDWILNGFSGQPGRFYLAVEFVTGHPGGIGSSWSRTPVYRIQGPEPPPIVADLSVSKEANPSSVAVGQGLTFTVTARNHGPSLATEVVVIDQLPAGFALINASTSLGDYNPEYGEWRIGELPVGFDAELVMTATAQPTGPYINTAQILGAEFDPEPANNMASVTVEVLQSRADLSISKIAQPSQAMPGQDVRFVVTVENLGPENATGVEVADQVPDGFTYLDHLVSTGSFDPVSGLWQVGGLVPGQQETLEIQVEINPLGDHTNVAVVSSAVLDPVPDNNSAAATVEVPQVPVGQIASIDFGANPVGSSSLRTGMLLSTGNGPLVVTGPVQLAQNSGGSYVIEEDLCVGLTLLPDERCFVDIRCAPGVAGPQPGLLRILTNAGAIDAPLSCNGTAPGLQINPGSVNFGQQAVGHISSSRTVTLSNTGQISLSLSNISLGGSHANNFSLTNGCGSSLAPGASCDLQVMFIPSTTGTRNATIQIVSNAPSSPNSVSLTGVGTGMEDDHIFRDRFQP